MYSTQDISNAIKGDSIINFPSAKISKLLTDSRKIEMANESLFFAISGQRLDGHQYIDDLYQKGVKNFVIENAGYENKYHDANFWKVKNSINTLQQLAQFHRLKFKIPLIGITGSNGKTIVKEWCHQLLQDNFKVVRSPKSYNSQIGVPLSVWNINENDNLGIFEAGISEPGEMQKLQKIIQPEIGIFTNIGAAHGANFLSQEHKVKEKLNLFIKSKVLIYCNDYDLIHKSIVQVFNESHRGENYGPKLLSWGKNNQAVIKVEEQFSEFNKTTVKLSFQDKKYLFEIPFVDASSIENALHCIVLMIYLKFSEEKINEQLQKIQRIAMRLEQKQGINNCLIINDSYNSDIDSLKIALDFLNQQQLQSSKTVILSDILQSGISPIDLYSKVFELLEKSGIKRLFGIGKAIAQNSKLLQEKPNFETFFYDATEDFLEHIHEYDFKDEAILLKGARKFEFEEISKFLEQKAHSTVLEINLNAIVHNLQYFNGALQKNTKMMVMVKAFSYGSGAYELAKLLEFHRVDYLGVAYTDEGVILRKAGIQTPILVLNPEIFAFDILIRNHLEPEIYNFKMLEAFVKAVEKNKLNKPYPIQINIDTGMKRLGFNADEIDKLIKFLKETKSINVVGIFSHLAAADDKNHDDFTKQQIELFDTLSKKIAKALTINPLRHISNTSGILRFPQANFDMVRLGIGLHGIANSSVANKLQIVSVLKSSISQINDLKKGESVGYGRAFIAEKDMKIATITIGYADGLSRKLSQGKGSVFLHGKKAPIIGNICMDMCMIDISNVPETTEGDLVEIFGENISVNEVAKAAETISYEILTNVSERVKRIYFWD